MRVFVLFLRKFYVNEIGIRIILYVFNIRYEKCWNFIFGNI